MSKITKLASLLVFAILFLSLLPKYAFAVNVTISDYPQTISSEPFNISVSVEGAQTGTNYLRVDLYKEGSEKYFGETYNGSIWYKESDAKQYFPITIQSGTPWTGQVQAKVGTPTISEYDNPGVYKMRIRRYTSSGNAGSEDASNSSVTVSINVVAATPTPTPTPKPTSTPTPTPQTTTTTKSSTPTPKASASPPKSKSSSSASPIVLGEKDKESSTPEATPQVEVSPSPQPQQGNSKTKIAALLTGSGAIIIGVSIAFFLWYRKTLEKT